MQRQLRRHRYTVDGFCLAVSHVEGCGAVMDFQLSLMNAMTHLGERATHSAISTCLTLLFRGRRRDPSSGGVEPTAETFQLRHNSKYTRNFELNYECGVALLSTNNDTC